MIREKLVKKRIQGIVYNPYGYNSLILLQFIPISSIDSSVLGYLEAVVFAQLLPRLVDFSI